MGRKNRRSPFVPAVMSILLLACYGIVGFNAYRLYTETAAVKEHVQELQTDTAKLKEQLKETEERSAAQDARMTELSAMENDLSAMRDNYYKACKELEDAVVAGTADCRIAYLTFDDGPYEATTGQYLDLLDQYDVLATFFLLAKNSEADDRLYHRIYNTGHTIANHSYSHQIKRIYTSTDTFITDVFRNREFIQEKLGITTNILRFPGGSSTAGPLKEEIMTRLRELGYGYVDWNSATGDGLYHASAEEYRDNVLKAAGGQSILVVLMHDYSGTTLAALPGIIEGLRAQGYVLLPLFYESTMVNK